MNFFAAMMLMAAPLWAQEAASQPKTEPVLEAEAPKAPEPKSEALKAPEAKAEAPEAPEPKPEAEKAPEPKAEAPKAHEPKPEAEKAPEPKAEAPKAHEPKPEAPKAKTLIRDRAREEGKAEAAFLKALLDSKDSEVPEAAVNEAFSLAARLAETPEGSEARLLAAALLRKKEEWQAAVTAYLGFLYEFPESDAAFRARQDFRELVDRRMPRKLKEPLMGLGQTPARFSRAERLAAMLKAAVEAAGAELYEPLLGEFARFRDRFPGYGEADKVQLWLADLHAKSGKYADSLHALNRLVAVYPQSSQLAQAQWNIAALYADNLKKYDKAVEAFQELARRHPKTPMVLPSMQRTAELLEERIKDYPAAVAAHERIVGLYPGSEGSLKALQNMARLQRDRLKAPQEAVAAFKRVAEAFGAPAAVEALKDAAIVARKSLKDYAQEAELKRLLATKFPDAEEAPETLFSVGEILEKDLKDDVKAKEAFQQVASKYPAHKLAKKAADRVAGIDKRSGQ
ncbi:MAG: tetratricopeptide repeat protein [Elusimicrobiota bacterium]|jgi:TolA-binding protein